MKEILKNPSIYNYICYVSKKHKNLSSIKISYENKIKETSYKTLFEDSKKISIYLNKKIKKRCKIAITGSFGYEWIISFLGIIFSGNIAVPFDDKESTLKIVESLNFIECEAVFCNKYFLEDNKDSKINVKEFFLFENVNSCLNKISSTETFKTPSLNIKETAVIIFTSGSTGNKKAVMLSQENIVHNVLHTVLLLGENLFSKEECTTPILPPYHMLLITVGFLLPFYYGMSLCFDKETRKINALFNKFKPSFIVAVPMMLEGFQKQITTNSKKIVCKNDVISFFGKFPIIACGGAVLRKQNIDFFKSLNIDVFFGYGITECSPVITCCKLNKGETKSVGKINTTSFCKVKIIDNEICVKGSTVMAGYYKNKSETDKAFSKNNWFRTGDLGRLEDNNLFITGRRKNLIILSDGNNISPEEMELDLKKFFSFIEDVVVSSEKVNDTNILIASIYLGEKNKNEKNILSEKIKINIKRFNRMNPAYKKISEIKIIDKSFNKTQLGKIKRNKANV